MTANAGPKATTSRADAACFGLVLVYLLGSVPTLEHNLVNADHSYQLTLGRQITLGAFPFVDLFSHYGPLVAFTSAAMFTIHDSVLPETILCALMYALAITLLFRVVRVYSETTGWAAILLASTAVVTSLFLMGRFYKWYFWFFPMLVLALACEILLDTRTDRSRYLRPVLAGLISGIAALYRFDLGLACAAAVLAGAALFALDNRDPIKALLQTMLISIGFIGPMVVWHAALIRAGGDPRDYWLATFDGASDVVAARRLPFPVLDPADPLSPSSILFVALIGTAAAYAGVVTAGGALAWHSRRQIPEAFRPLILAALMGLAIFPQTVHRPDLGHFMTVLPPLIALASLGIVPLWRRAVAKRNRFARSAVVLLVIATALIAAGLESAAIRDVDDFGKHLFTRYRFLARGPEAYVQAHPEPDRRREIRTIREAQFLQYLHDNTEHNDTILPYGIIGPLHFVKRRVAGLFPRYVDGIFDSDHWIDRDHTRIKVNVPALVVMPIKTGHVNLGASMYDTYIDENFEAVNVPNDVPMSTGLNRKYAVYVPRAPVKNHSPSR